MLVKDTFLSWKNTYKVCLDVLVRQDGNGFGKNIP
jgi:hypothetical protein